MPGIRYVQVNVVAPADESKCLLQEQSSKRRPPVPSAQDSGRGRLWEEARYQEAWLQRPDPDRQLHSAWRDCLGHKIIHVETHAGFQVADFYHTSVCKTSGASLWVEWSEFRSYSTCDANWKEGLPPTLLGIKWYIYSSNRNENLRSLWWTKYGLSRRTLHQKISKKIHLCTFFLSLNMASRPFLCRTFGNVICLTFRWYHETWPLGLRPKTDLNGKFMIFWKYIEMLTKLVMNA